MKLNKLHEIKIDINHFNALQMGLKKAEIRLNDRDYKVGDLIKFKVCINGIHEKSFDNLMYTNKYEITHILTHHDFPEGLKENYVMLSIEGVSNDEYGN